MAEMKDREEGIRRKQWRSTTRQFGKEHRYFRM